MEETQRSPPPPPPHTLTAASCQYTLYHVPRMISSCVVMAVLELGAPVKISTLTVPELKSPEYLR